MSVLISDEILQSSRMSEDELKQEIALLLFQKEKLTLAQASHFAGMPRLQFQHLLASRDLTVHYDVADFEKDLETIRKLEAL